MAHSTPKRKKKPSNNEDAPAWSDLLVPFTETVTLIGEINKLASLANVKLRESMVKNPGSEEHVGNIQSLKTANTEIGAEVVRLSELKKAASRPGKVKEKHFQEYYNVSLEMAGIVDTLSIIQETHLNKFFTE